MTADSTFSVLNRLLALHYRSLARYLSYASPTWHRGEERSRAALRAIAEDQMAIVDRLGKLIIDSGGTVEYGHFPIAFTGYHDLGFDFLLKKLIEGQRREIGIIEQCVTRLSLNPIAKALAEESLGAAKGHLETLLELEHSASSGSAPAISIH